MVKVGDIINYVPSTDYWLDLDENNDFVYELFHTNTDANKQPKRYFGPENPAGRMLPKVALRPGKPLKHWKAKVLAIHNGITLDLEVYHPRAKIYHTQVRRDDNHRPDSWYPNPEVAEPVTTSEE